MTMEISQGVIGTETRAPTAATAMNRWLSPGMSQMPDWSVEDAIAFQYYANVVVYAAVRAIAQDIAALDFRAGLDIDDPTSHNKNSRLAQLLGPEPGSPNEELSSTTFWEHTVASYLLGGCFCWEIEYSKGTSQVYQLWPLMMQYTRPIPSRDPRYYFSGVEYTARGKSVVFNRDKALYHWKPSMRDIRQPESFLDAAKLSVSVMVMQDRYDYSFLKNDARPAAVIVHEAFATTAERDTWRENFTNTHVGPENAGRIHWVEASEDGAPPKDAFAIQQLGLSQADAEFIARYDQKLRDVVMATGVPMSRLGDSSERTFSNADKEYEIYRNNVLIPKAKELQTFVNRRLAPRVGREFGWFDTRPWQELARNQKIIGLGLPELVKHKILKLNEARASLGLEGVDGGDRFITDEELALFQQGAVALLKTDPGIVHTEKNPETLEAPTPVAPPEPQPTPDPAASTEIEDSAEDEAEDEAEDDARGRGQRAARSALEQRRLNSYKKTDRTVLRLEAEFERKFDQLLEKQLKITLDRLEGKRGRKFLAEQRDAAGAGIFDKGFWENSTRDEFREAYEKVFGDAAANLFESLGLQLTFDIDAEYAKDYITTRANQLAGNVTQTTYDAIQRELADGAALGEDIPSLAKRIRNLFQQTYKNRARTVARTEVISAYNGSTHRQAEALGKDVVAAQEWIATPGTRTRHTHRAADGQVKPFGNGFEVGGAVLKYPGDPSGPAKEVVNCRCALGLLTPAEAAERGVSVS